jgi:hypothetical protein
MQLKELKSHEAIIKNTIWGRGTFVQVAPYSTVRYAKEMDEKC